MTIALGGASLNQKTWRGVSFGVGAGALWGFVFIAPKLASGFTPLQLTIGRYLAYGAFSAICIAPRWANLTKKLCRSDWYSLAWLALTGNILYYILLSLGVQLGGIAMTSLVLGLLPVSVTIIGSRERGSVPLRRLAPSLVLCAAGAICIASQTFAGRHDEPFASKAIGLSCAIGALISWTAFAAGNSKSLRKLGHISPYDWNLLTGVVTGAQAMILLPFALLAEQARHTADDWLRFAGVSLSLAIFASIVGNALWNRMSRILPLTMVGQMILFETIFALIYGFIWESRLPEPFELCALALIVVGVLTCLAAHRRSPARC